MDKPQRSPAYLAMMRERARKGGLKKSVRKTEALRKSVKLAHQANRDKYAAIRAARRYGRCESVIL